MRKSLYGVALAAMVAASAAGAQEDRGFYLKAGFGYGGPTGKDVKNAFGVANSDARLTADSDFRPMLGAGYAFGNDWRVDFDAVQRYNELGAGGTVEKSDLNGIALMANIIRDFDQNLTPGFDIDPYIGAGIGAAQYRFSIQDANQIIVNDETNLAGQVFAGLGWRITDRLTADAEYRYFQTADNDVLIGDVKQSLQSPSSHDVFLGLRYSFGPRAVAQDAPPPPPPPAADTYVQPVVICDDVPFVVYFGWDESALTSQAQQVISNAADQADECDITQVNVEGHTDRSGSAAYNRNLSRQRAESVRDALIREGVPSSTIRIEAKGEGDTAVETPDGVREPLNRRSEVLIIVAN